MIRSGGGGFIISYFYGFTCLRRTVVVVFPITHYKWQNIDFRQTQRTAKARFSRACAWANPCLTVGKRGASREGIFFLNLIYSNRE